MAHELFHKLKHLPSLFDSKYRLSGEKSKPRRRTFTTHNFFWTMLKLVSSKAEEGYDHALTDVFMNELEERVPSKSAFSQFRSEIKFEFFKDCLEKLLLQAEVSMAKFGGLRIYAIDGQQLTLPRSKDIEKQGFNGRAVGEYKETYLPRGYLTHMYDVINGVTKRFTFNSTLNEHQDAKTMISQISERCLVLYDRLFFSEELINLHFDQGTYFMMRCRQNANASVARFFSNKDKKKTSFSYGERRVYLIKVKNPKTGGIEVFATNLPKPWRNRQLIKKLYLLRWEVENFFREFTAITKGEQWHSKSFNGIMQEIYARFWKINFTKITMAHSGQKPLDPHSLTYKKANFKLICDYIAKVIVENWQKLQFLTAYVAYLIKRSTQQRKRLSRSYPRQLKHPASPYPYSNTGWFGNLN